MISQGISQEEALPTGEEEEGWICRILLLSIKGLPRGPACVRRVQPITYLAINCQARQVTCPEEQPGIPHRDGPPRSCEPGQAAKRGPGGVGGVWPRWDQGSSVCASLPVSEQPGSSPLIPPLFSILLSPRALDYFSLQSGLCSCPTVTYSHRVEHNGEYS